MTHLSGCSLLDFLHPSSPQAAEPVRQPWWALCWGVSGWARKWGQLWPQEESAPLEVHIHLWRSLMSSVLWPGAKATCICPALLGSFTAPRVSGAPFSLPGNLGAVSWPFTSHLTCDWIQFVFSNQVSWCSGSPCSLQLFQLLFKCNKSNYTIFYIFLKNSSSGLQDTLSLHFREKCFTKKKKKRLWLAKVL